MKFSDWVIMLSTFFIGVATGAFVYLNGFRDIDIDPVVPTSVDEFEIQVTVYGNQLPHYQFYRIQQTGFYVFIDSDNAPVEGYLTKDQIESLFTMIKKTNLVEQSRPVTPDFCESWTGGVDTKYEIKFKDKTYVLNTCGTAVDSNSDLIQLLDWLLVQFKDNK